MKYILLLILLISLLVVPVHASQLEAPEVPGDVSDLMPPKQESFGEGLWYVIRSAVEKVNPDIAQAGSACVTVMVAALITGVLSGFSGAHKSVTQLAGTAVISVTLLSGTKALIFEGIQTINQISEYGKLLLPVMTAALASQGGITSSAAAYTATALFDTVLMKMIQVLLFPLLMIFIALAISSSALANDMLVKLKDATKKLIGWGLRCILYIFTGYISITGVVSGTADQTALRATKLTIAGMVPVVGGILSDASEAVLVGAGTIKNAAGIYGLLAILALAIGPFIRIGIHYLLFKLCALACSILAEKRLSDLIQDFSAAMGLVLAMTGSVCLLFLISIICMMRGMS